MAHGGIKVLVREIVQGSGNQIQTFLGSNQGLSEVTRLIYPSIQDVFIWSLAAKPSLESRRLVDWLEEHKVDLAQFHFGTNGWYTRSWAGCPIPYLARSGIPCVATNHGAFTLL